MDSPDRNLTIAPTDSQGSPFFNYLCSLSPIKPVKSGHMIQTFAELSVPPPPAVFISPRVDTQKDSIPFERKSSIDRWESTQATSRKCEEKFQCDEEVNFLLHSSHVKATKSSWNQFSNCHHGCFESINTAGSGLSSPSSRLSMYGNRNASHFMSEPDKGVSQQCSSGSLITPDLVAPSVCIGDPSSNDLVEYEVAPHNQLVPSKSLANKNTSEGAVSCQISPSLDFQYLSTAISREESISTKQIGTGFAMLSKDTDNKLKVPFWETHGKPPDLQKYSNNEQLLELDQATTGITSISSMELGKISPHGDKHDQQISSAVQSEIPIQHMLGFLAAIREIVEEDTQLVDLDSESFQSKLSFLSDRKLERVLDLQNDGETQNESGRRGFRAAMSGVRRRCLDFETTDAQQRRQNNLPMLETLGLSPDKLSHCASSHGSDANSASSLLNERITAITDVRSGQSPHLLELNTLVSSKEDLVSCSSIASMDQSAIFNPHCASPNNADCVSLQCDTQMKSINNSPEISPVPIEAPSGLGLHLNNLGKSLPFSYTRDESMNCCAVSSSSKSEKFSRLAPLSGLSEVSSESYGDYMLSGANILSGCTGNFGQGLMLSLIERTQLDQHEVQSAGSAQVGLTKSTTCVRSVTLDFKSIEDLPFGDVENIINPLGGKRVFLQDIPHETESDQAEDSGNSPKSPKKKRKISISIGEKPGEGCKRCNCKKSKCLKLYCECFAAGVYCIDPCSCHDCFNKPEFEETVLGTRQQIESRNPLAFAPKVVRASDLSPTNGEECIYTPASARHKRGCNCKKSQCLKKYCECYQAGVGCADGCRCEGCKNIYGRKEEEEKADQVAVLENESTYDLVNTLDLIEHQNEQQNMDLSPLTPSFEHSEQCMSTVELRSSSSRRQCPFEELSPPLFSVPAPMPFRSPSKLFRFLKGGENTFVTSTHSLKTEGSPACIKKFTRAGQFSPRWDGLGDICTLTPPPHSLLQPAPASASFLDKAPSCPSVQPGNEHSTAYINVEPNDLIYGEISSSPIVQHSGPPVFTYGSYQYQALENALTAPMTYMPSSYCHALEVKHDSGKPVHTQSPEYDDTPNFLKDSNALCAPAIILKTRSPQQKRVSSHQQTPRGTSFRDMLSPGLRSGWKFILQSMPSFSPPNPAFPSTNAGMATDYLNQSQ